MAQYGGEEYIYACAGLLNKCQLGKRLLLQSLRAGSGDGLLTRA